LKMNKKYPRFIYIPLRETVNGCMRIEYEIENGKLNSPTVDYSSEKLSDSSVLILNSYMKNIPLVSRLSFTDNYACEELYASALEELMNIEVPEVAKYLRVMILELSRISGFFLYMFNVASAMEFEMVKIWALSDMNRIRKYISLIKGDEYFSPYIIPGGVSGGVLSHTMNQIYYDLEKIQIRMKDYDKLFFENEIFKLKTKNVGVISKQVITDYGITGFISRSANITFDVRKKLPYEIYHETPIENRVYDKSDCYSRIMSKKNDMDNSIRILDYLFSNIPRGSIFLNRDAYSLDKINIPEGRSVKRVEAANGEFICFVESDGTDKPKIIKFRSPMYITGGNFLNMILEQTSLDDIDIVLASLSLMPMEMNI